MVHTAFETILLRPNILGITNSGYKGDFEQLLVTIAKLSLRSKDSDSSLERRVEGPCVDGDKRTYKVSDNLGNEFEIWTYGDGVSYYVQINNGNLERFRDNLAAMQQY